MGFQDRGPNLPQFEHSCHSPNARVTDFFSFIAHGSWSHSFEERRGRPEEEWVGSKTKFIESTKLQRREGTGEGCHLSF